MLKLAAIANNSAVRGCVSLGAPPPFSGVGGKGKNKIVGIYTMYKGIVTIYSSNRTCVEIGVCTSGGSIDLIDSTT